MRLAPSLCALLLGAGTAFAAGCGDRSGLLPPSAANEVKSELGTVRDEVDAGNCPGAGTAIDRARSAVNNVEGLDAKLRSHLLGGIGTLAGRAKQECVQDKPDRETEPDTTTTDTTDTTPTTPETTPTDTDPVEPPPTDPGVPSTPVEPTVPDPDGGVSPDDPSFDPGGATPDTGGADPGDAGAGDDGFGARDRDNGGVEGYYP
ncbi:hypothetical protein [Paraconexibacter sp. AEG42_29]